MIRFVTSFSADGFNRYAKHMLESVVENWKPDLHLTAYYHDFPEDLVAELPQAPHIEYRNLNEVQDMLDYRERMKIYDGTANGKAAYNWRMDAIKWCHKVYAMTEYALEISENEAQGGWLCWIDADTITDKPFSEEKLRDILVDKADLVHLGRRDCDYSETSFMAFNLNYQTAIYLLADLRGCYEIGEVVSYREWHDGFIFERLLKIYTAHGMKVQDLTPHAKGLAAFQQSALSQYMTHFKGNLKNNLSDTDVSPDVHMPRYKQLATLVRTYANDKIIETGTWNGGRAIEMSLAAFEKTDKLHYIGFDLFEDATEETDQLELNSKPHNSMAAVQKRLVDFAAKMAERGKTFTFKLYKGDTKTTLAEQKDSLNNAFVYIDGGHSKETVMSDYENLKHNSVVIVNGFFTADENQKMPPQEHHGVNELVSKVGTTNFNEVGVTVLPSTDKVNEGGVVHLAVFRNDIGLPEIPKEIRKIPIVVRPRDSMPKDYIVDSINENVELISRWGFVKKCKPNDKHAIIVSAGPSLDFKELKKVIRQTKGTVFCVKHSYPKLLKNNIQPFACVVLDPRSIDGKSTHGIVRKDLFENIDKKTKFLIASMTDVSVTKHLLSKTDNIYGFHAYSQAIAEQAKGNQTFEINKKVNIPQETVFVTGGTCSATRSIGMSHILGFRNFHLFGFDCCIPDITDEMKEEKLEDGKPKYMPVETNGVDFWTTGELLAMAQDCERMFNDQSIEMNISLYGENTLVSEVYKNSYHAQRETYLDCFDTAA